MMSDEKIERRIHEVFLRNSPGLLYIKSVREYITTLERALIYFSRTVEDHDLGEYVPERERDIARYAKDHTGECPRPSTDEELEEWRLSQ